MGRNGDIFDFHFDTEKFKFYLKNRDKKVTYQDLMEILYKNGIESSEATIKKWLMSKEDNKTKPKPQYIKILCNALNIPFNEVILQDVFRNDNQINFRYFPDIYASAGLGTSSQSEEVKIVSVDENFLKEILDIPIKKSYDIIKINGDSMEPILSNGDFIIIDRSKNSLGAISNADIVIFRKNDDLFCKKIKKEPFADYIFLVSENKKYEDKKVDNSEFEQCEILGTVVSKMAVETFKNFIEVVG
ncbi:S24 family peptidase [Campylobacter coli]|nr:S24 family peptidase [Campylobacter coli]